MYSLHHVMDVTRLGCTEQATTENKRRGIRVVAKIQYLISYLIFSKDSERLQVRHWKAPGDPTRGA